MSNSGKEGERLFSEWAAADGYIVNDLSGDSYYFDKDIDFLLTNPTTGNSRTFEVKWCYGISKYGNLFLEFINPRSQ